MCSRDDCVAVAARPGQLPALNASDLEVYNVPEAEAIFGGDLDEAVETPVATMERAKPQTTPARSLPEGDGVWPALPCRNKNDDDWEVMSAVSDWVDAKLSFKEALQQGWRTNEVIASRPVPPPTARTTKKKAHREKEKDMPILEEDDVCAWFGAVGDAELDYARRTRRSKQSASSRDRRMALKAKPRQ